MLFKKKLKKLTNVKDRWNSRERGILYLLSNQPGTGMALAASSGFTSSILAGLLRASRSRVKWRHNETRTVYDRDLFVQGDKLLHAPGTRKMVTDRALVFLKDKGENTAAQGWIEQTQHSLSGPVYHHLLHVYLKPLKHTPLLK